MACTAPLPPIYAPPPSTSPQVPVRLPSIVEAVLAKRYELPVNFTEEEQTEWDCLFPEEAGIGGATCSSSLAESSGSPTARIRRAETSQSGNGPGQLSKFWPTLRRRNAAPPDPSSPPLLLDRLFWNGLRIVGEIDMIKEGFFGGIPATLVRFSVLFLNSDDAHKVKRAMVRVKVGGADGPTPESSAAATNSSDSILVMPGAYPLSRPTAPTVPAGTLPYFSDHRPVVIVGPSEEEVETTQGTRGGTFGTATNPFVNLATNLGWQRTRAHTLSFRSTVMVETQPADRRPFGERSGSSLTPARTQLCGRARSNPQHQYGFREVRVGAIVISHGRAFTLTMEVQCETRNRLHFRKLPYTDTRPALIRPGQTLSPSNEEPITVNDFSSPGFPWHSIVPMPAGFREVPPGTTI